MDKAAKEKVELFSMWVGSATYLKSKNPFKMHKKWCLSILGFIRKFVRNSVCELDNPSESSSLFSYNIRYKRAEPLLVSLQFLRRITNFTLLHIDQQPLKRVRATKSTKIFFLEGVGGGVTTSR